MIDLSHRRREAEWMDEPDADPELLRRSLAYIRWVNTLFGYTRAILWHIKRFSRGWKPGERIKILDVGTGSADIPRAILRWAKRRGFAVHIVGLDLQAAVAIEAARSNPLAALSIVQGDALALPFADSSFDYAITSMFLHHLSDQQVVNVFREMSRVARRGIIAADILRSRRAYRWIKLFTLFANPMVRHDAPVSVAQAFNREEVIALQVKAEIIFASYRRHFGHRFILAGEKTSNG